MQNQQIEFTVCKRDGVVTQIGKSAIYQPKTVFKGTGNTVWHEDTYKKDARQVQR